MAKGLGLDVEKAINVILKGLEYSLDINEIDPEDVKTAMDSKTSSFKSAKELMNKWANSPNRPNDKKLKSYVSKLVKSGEDSINTLREALVKEIDFSQLKPTDHAKAIKAKPVIYNAIVEIENSIRDLQHQLDNDNLNLSEREFNIGYAERFANGDFFPLENYYKDWNNITNNAVKICPKGTEGEIINLGGLRIQLPEVPVDKSEILFSDLPKSEQYWRRQPPPKGLSRDNAEAFDEYIIEEYRRRREGVWFMNNGKPVYLTGAFYFTLQWCKMKDNNGYMEFREAQLRLSYHTKACEIDSRALGQVFFKGRRTGFTYEKIFFLLDRSTSNKNWRVGITSKTEGDAKEAFEKYVYALRQLPFFFQPVVKGKIDNTRRIEFAKPSNNTKEAKKKGEDDIDLYLNSLVDYKATSEGSYDSTKLNDYLSDEFLKWSPSNYLSHYKQVSPTMDENGVIVGKYWAGSTMGARGKGGEHVDYFLEKSNPKERSEISQRTETGLYSYFLPAHKNSRLHTDKYGVCHEKIDGFIINTEGSQIKHGSIKYFQERLEKAKRSGEVTLSEELRNHPMQIEDLLRAAESKNSFNKKKIYEQRRINASFPIAPYVRGNFRWEDGIRYGKVVFSPNENGRWVVMWHPPEEDRNRYEFRGTVRCPTRHFCKMGIDPYESSVTMQKGSDGAGTVILQSHYNNPELRNSIVCHYLSRPKKIYDFFEDMLMTAVYYGASILAENNKNAFNEWMTKELWGGYLMQDPLEEDVHKLKKGKKGINMTSSKNREALIQVTEAYIEDEVGQLENREGCMYVKEILNDWENFDPENWTPYDSTISAGLAILATKKRRVAQVNSYDKPDFWLKKWK